MGAWDIGPFDNDMAADFAGALDRAPAARRVELVRAALLSSCCAAAGAQGPLTSPSGYLASEGDSFHPWLVATERRFQQVDATHRGAAHPALRSIAFRRDATLHAGYTQPSKTFDLTVLMGYSDLATFGTTFAANYKGAPTTIVQPRQVSVPTWTPAPRARWPPRSAEVCAGRWTSCSRPMPTWSSSP